MRAAPDPGRLRLRSALRGVLGVGAAVAACGVTGHPLTATVAGGLAALLALFAVTDPTVRGQLVTTALLPAVGMPVLALAAAVQDRQPARDAAFLAVATAAVHARRWGPRGHALGVFAFMTYFLAQFLRTVPAELPGLYSALAVALLTASAVRFGVWCYERRLPVPVVPAPPGGRALARATTRQTVQVACAVAFALAVGQLLSLDRWYWAVGAAWWIFVNTVSRGETLVRGFRRVLGTVAGIAAGALLAVPLHGAAVPTAVLAALCVFGVFYTAAVSYSWMMFSVTLLVALLYGVLGELTPGLLALRLAETGVGAVGAWAAVAFVLPVTTHAATHAWTERAVHAMHAVVTATARHPHPADGRTAGGGAAGAELAVLIAELEAVLGRARLALAPLLHPLNPLRARKGRARQVLALLDASAREVRALAAVAAQPHTRRDARLADAALRVEAAVLALTAPAPRPAAGASAGVAPAVPAGAGVTSGAGATSGAAPASGNGAGPAHVRPPTAAPERHRGAEAALHHLQGLERALTALATPLHSAPRSPLVGVDTPLVSSNS